MPTIPGSHPDAGNGLPKWPADIVFDLHDFHSTVKPVEAGWCQERQRAPVLTAMVRGRLCGAWTAALPDLFDEFFCG
jgi:hypothetical protein